MKTIMKMLSSSIDTNKTNSSFAAVTCAFSFHKLAQIEVKEWSKQTKLQWFAWLLMFLQQCELKAITHVEQCLSNWIWIFQSNLEQILVGNVTQNMTNLIHLSDVFSLFNKLILFLKHHLTNVSLSTGLIAAWAWICQTLTTGVSNGTVVTVSCDVFVVSERERMFCSPLQWVTYRSHLCREIISFNCRGSVYFKCSDADGAADSP